MVGIETAVAGLGTSISAVLKFADNFVIAYFLVLSFVLIDAGVSAFLPITGITGTALTVIINGLGVPIIIYSWHLLILLGIAPVAKYCFFD